VINVLTTLLAHATPLHHHNILLSENYPTSIFFLKPPSTKNTTLKGDLTLKILFQGKGDPLGLVNTW